MSSDGADHGPHACSLLSLVAADRHQEGLYAEPGSVFSILVDPPSDLLCGLGRCHLSELQLPHQYN